MKFPAGHETIAHPAGQEEVWSGHETNAEMLSTYIYPRRKFEIIIIWPWILDVVLFTREL